MTPEQKQRIEQIRERQEHNKSAASVNPIPKFLATAYNDIDFLLSLVKSQEAENGYWPTLLDRGDGVRDHFCIGRLIKPGEIYWEFWNKGRWVSAGEVFVGRETAQKQLDAIRASDATSMRSACVEKVRELQDQWAANRTTFGASNDRAHIKYGTMVDASRDIIIALESLSIEKPKE